MRRCCSFIKDGTMAETNRIEKYLPLKATVHAYDNLFAYELPPGDIVRNCEFLYHRHHLPLKMITAFDERQATGSFRMMYLFGVPKENVFLAPFIMVNNHFPSLTPSIHEASTYERKIMSFFGLIPQGHPDPRPIILHENWPEHCFPLRKDFAGDIRPDMALGTFPFRKISGEGIYEIPVGPVHAGIIEPGHFRFSVAGEEILFLEPRLGYSHKGSEKLFETLPLPDKIRLSERISGDSSCSHSLAFCLAIESLSGIPAGEKAGYLRVIFCELERLANHLGDIGAIMTDTGFTFGGSHGARLREIVMQMSERLTGSRFLRGVNTFGGVSKEITPETAGRIDKELDELRKDFSEVMAVAEKSHSLLNRLKNTGVLPSIAARDHGVVGVAGKAVGFAADARWDYPYAAYDQFPPDIATEESGDVYARFSIRVKEVYSSLDLIKKALRGMPGSSDVHPRRSDCFKKNAYALGIVEGWRGDIVYLIATDDRGSISRVAVRDPSFLNWTALSYAAVGNIVPDFPLINKSFNLSYSGNDL
jgi:Ni,Fe-hydrogenase III large subunit/Ni,Fe-hydrogenase III component G